MFHNGWRLGWGPATWFVEFAIVAFIVAAHPAGPEHLGSDVFSQSFAGLKNVGFRQRLFDAEL